MMIYLKYAEKPTQEGIQLLIHAGDDVNHKDDKGKNVLDYAKLNLNCSDDIL